MTAKELQEEELEVLRSIYEGDAAFKEINATTFQYKVGEEGNNKSFLVEVRWGENYPDELPDINLNVFYNKHIVDCVKSTVTDKLREEGEVFLGSAITYTLFEHAKENAEELMSEQVHTAIQSAKDEIIPAYNSEDPSKKKEKKEQLTKSQKRRLYDKFGNQQAEKPRGWDWVDVVKHLNQTGGGMADS